ncbi:hypothetical protein H0H87_009321, partial [Tephrocybe sp. NHM501043]
MAESPQFLAELRVSEKFNAADAEVVFKSSDNVLFHIHRSNLMACTEGFSPPETSTFNEIVTLTEPTATLELLFAFIYPQPLPDLGGLDFDILAALAEAAEKYRVFAAMNLCTIHMGNHLKDHPEEILIHGLKHGIRKLVARTAPLLLDSPLEYLLPHLPDRFLIPWVRYHTHWTRIWMSTISNTLSIASMAKVECTCCNKLPHDYVLDAMAKLSSRLSALQNLDIIFPPHTPICCSDTRILLEAWRDTFRAEIIKIPTFADLAFPLDAVPADR